MAFQKGPGEGYMSAKTRCLASNPRLFCEQKHATHHITGYVVYDGDYDHPEVSAGSARDAWNKMLLKIGIEEESI